MSKILVVDDHASIGSVVIAMLEAEGHEIQRAKDIAMTSSLSLGLITTQRRTGKRKAKPWDSPYPS